MFSFFEENKGIKIVAIAVIIISIFSYFSGMDRSEILDHFQIKGRKKTKEAVPATMESLVEKRLDQIDAKHLNHNDKGNSTSKGRNLIDCPPGTVPGEDNEQNREQKEKFLYCVDKDNPNTKEGPYISWGQHGFKNEEGFFKYGKLDGKITHWGSSNKKSDEIEYLNGQRSGSFASWYPNGTLQIEGAYLNDQKTGTWKYYDKIGKIISITEMNNNLKNGKIENYYENGKLEFSGTYKNDRQEGKWSFYNKDGSLQTEGTFQNGRKVGNWVGFGSSEKPLFEKNYDKSDSEKKEASPTEK